MMHGKMWAHFRLSTLVAEFATRLSRPFGVLQTLCKPLYHKCLSADRAVGGIFYDIIGLMSNSAIGCHSLTGC